MSIDLTPPFTREDVDIIERERAYDGFFAMDRVTLRHRLFEGGWGPTVSRELFVRGEAVAAVVFDPERNLVGMVEQFRIGAMDEEQGPWCLEVVAGMVEEGEQPEEVVKRELVEETGIEAESMEYICNYMTSPGGTSEKLHLYCVLADLSEAGGIHGLEEEGEDIRVRVFEAPALFDAMLKGRFNNAATLICLQWLQINQDRLRGKIG
ncbi:NUDIX domain-containing protein [Maricurvus nonylphenolicus]|uniref:NUDIX domain-containing protein n=1 Tax=Maricurvus nonylphenolicus TaxID=1008307 RepID=UPI0036F21D5B